MLESLKGVQQGPFICFDLLLGLLAQTIGNLDDAQTHFEGALAFTRKAGYQTELAWSLCDYVDMLLHRNAEGDRERATAHLDESLAISNELGMKPLIERLEALDTKLRTLPPAKVECPDSLTEREVEVLRLLASGMTNPEIAEELFITRRTVTYHISNIFGKTLTSNRRDAASYARRHNLA